MLRFVEANVQVGGCATVALKRTPQRTKRRRVMRRCAQKAAIRFYETGFDAKSTRIIPFTRTPPLP